MSKEDYELFAKKNGIGARINKNRRFESCSKPAGEKFILEKASNTLKDISIFTPNTYKKDNFASNLKNEKNTE